MKISIPIFNGMRPLSAAHLLELGEAQEAIDVDIDGGDLRPAPAPLKKATLVNDAIKNIRRWTESTNEHWLEFEDDVDIQKGPVADDSFERIYFTGLTEPRFFANDNVSDPFDQAADYIKLGVPAPSGALTATGYTPGSIYRAYVYTFVNRYGEEGPPSPLLEKSDYGSGNVTLAGFSAPTSGYAIDKIRVYRTNSNGAGISEFQLVFATDLKIYSATATYNSGDLVVYNGSLFKCVQNNTTGVTPVGSATEWDDWYDNIADASLQADVLVSMDWEPPPSGLKGLCTLPNGSMAGFVGSTVYIGEPYYPHAWPQGTYSDDFTYTQPAPVVALKVLGASLVVMTQGPTIILSGSQPGQMSSLKLPGLYPCVSKRSASESSLGILYGARAGLILATIDSLVVVTAALLSESDWSNYVPSAMHGAFHQGKYIGFYNAQAGFQLDFNKKTFSNISFYASAIWAAEDDGILYIVKNDAIDPNNPPATIPQAVMQWAGSDIETLYFTWKSGLMLTPAAANFGAARVTIDSDYMAAMLELIAADDTVLDFNAALFAAGGVNGGLAGTGLNVYGLNGDNLRSLTNIRVGSSVIFKWYCDGAEVFSKLISNSDPFRLPAGFRSKQFEIKIEGYVPVRAVEVASGMEELYQ